MSAARYGLPIVTNDGIAVDVANTILSSVQVAQCEGCHYEGVVVKKLLPAYTVVVYAPDFQAVTDLCNEAIEFNEAGKLSIKESK